MATKRSQAAIPREWLHFLAGRGLKLSGPRGAVLEAFFAARGHVSLDEIRTLARKREPKVALATVYRTMKLLEEAGLAERHEFHGKTSRYETTVGRSHHDHLICQSCGAIFEFESPEIEALQERIARELSFAVRGHRHEIYGVCVACLQEAAASGAGTARPGRSGEPS